MTDQDRQDLIGIIARIVDQVNPLRIVLFGSRARGDARPTSDADLLVLVPPDDQFRARWATLLDAVAPYSLDADLVLTTPEEFAWRSQVPGFVQYDAARHGWILYERG
jgi:predicted nucleotidyltransferase